MSAALGRTNDAFDKKGCLNVSRAEFDAASDAACSQETVHGPHEWNEGHCPGVPLITSAACEREHNLVPLAEGEVVCVDCGALFTYSTTLAPDELRDALREANYVV